MTEQEIRSLVQETVRQANNIFKNKVVQPEVKFTLTGTVAGWADYSGVLNFNKGFFHEPKYFETVIHEVAHLVVHANWPKAKPHGQEFVLVCRTLGIDGSRCHDYDTTEVKHVRNYTRHVATCGCQEHFLIAKTAEQIKNGWKISVCRTCKKELKVTGEIRKVRM